MLFEGTAFAQASAPAGGSQDWGQILGNPIVPIAFIFVIMYFLILRPQTKKASDHQKMLSALKRNDEVVTTGGLIGRVDPNRRVFERRQADEVARIRTESP